MGQIAGLGVHITEIYPLGRSYLKSLFNALEAFCGDRNVDGWRLTGARASALALALEEEHLTADEGSSGGQGSDGGAAPREVQDYPASTGVTSELLTGAESLLDLFSEEEPLVLPIRPTGANKLRYFAADASAEGFDLAMQYPDGSTSRRDGLWMPTFAGDSSSLREATAQVNHILTDVRKGRHGGCEVWCATDNAVWSAVWHKGMSSARHLSRLVLNLKRTCHEHEVKLNPFHISGERMIACGING